MNPSGTDPMQGQAAPVFCLPDAGNTPVCLESFRESWVVLYFYPKDNTSACTKEAKDFSSAAGDFKELGAVILGVSPDPVKSHENFIKKQDLSIRLLSDTEHRVLHEYGVWRKKKMYGREYYGVERSTFLIRPGGGIAEVWRKVKVNGHVSEVKKKLEEQKQRAE
jgi:peroxiredoxin Q/BCP